MTLVIIYNHNMFVIQATESKLDTRNWARKGQSLNWAIFENHNLDQKTGKNPKNRLKNPKKQFKNPNNLLKNPKTG